jgi:hypothetical protein
VIPPDGHVMRDPDAATAYTNGLRAVQPTLFDLSACVSDRKRTPEHDEAEPKIDVAEIVHLHEARPPRSARRKYARWELAWVRAWHISIHGLRG